MLHVVENEVPGPGSFGAQSSPYLSRAGGPGSLNTDRGVSR